MRPPSPDPRIPSLLIGAALFAIGGCVAAPPVTPLPAFDLYGSLPPSPGIRLRLERTERGVQALPASWASASFTLTSPTMLTAPRTETYVRTSDFTVGGLSAQTNAAIFPSSRPGSDYTLYASTFAGAVRTAMGVAGPLVLSSGVPAAATITLATLPTWTAGTLANPSNGSGSGGDAGPPADASFNAPDGLAFGSDGTLYVADKGNDRIRKVNPARTQVDLVVSGLGQPRATAFAPGIDGGQDVLFVADTGNSRICYVTNLGGTPQLNTLLTTTGKPLALCFESTGGSLIVAQDDDTVLQFPNPLSPSYRTLIGTSSTAVSDPGGLAYDAARQALYVADTGNRRVIRLDLSTFASTLVAGNGQAASAGDGGRAVSASMAAPSDLALDAANDRLYVLDGASYALRVVTLGNGMIASAFGTGTSAYAGDTQSAQSAKLLAPQGIAFNGTTLFVSDGNRLRFAQ